MRVSIFAGDLIDAPADALCTSTNPRLSLMMGTGGAVRDRAGWGVLRECEAIMEESAKRGRPTLLPGSVHVTSGGKLPQKFIFHCIASDNAHVSSESIIRACVRNALAAADERSMHSLAMPVFATGHARFRYEKSLAAIASALGDSQTTVSHVIIVVDDAERIPEARKVLRTTAPSLAVE